MERDLLYREINAFSESEIHLFDTGKYSGILKEKSFLGNDDLKTVQSVDGKKLFFAKSEYVAVLGENEGWFLVEGNVMTTDKGIDTYYVKPGSAAPSKVTGWIKGARIDIKRPYIIPPRSIKIEIQTKNYVRRTDGTKKNVWYPLPRKYGPVENNYLYVGVKGDPPKFEIKDDKLYKKEGTAIELQSESGGFLEFETPTWFQKWSELKKRVKEAKEMAEKLNGLSGVTMDIKVRDSHSSTGFSNFKDAKIVKFPDEYNIDHLRKGTFPENQKKLLSKEYLEVAIVDDKWPSGIQISEAIELTQFESLLTQFVSASITTEVKTKATAILTKANTAKLASSSLINLKSFLQIIVYYIICGQIDPGYGRFPPSKYYFGLMNRTSFSSIFKYILEPKEQELFKYIVAKKLILLELFGYGDDKPFFIKGHEGKETKPTIYNWLNSIIKPYKGKDLLSYSKESRHSKGYILSNAMGRFNIDKKYGKWDKVKFEIRSLGHDFKSDIWITFIENYFKQASTKRSSTGTDRLIYDP